MAARVGKRTEQKRGRREDRARVGARQSALSGGRWRGECARNAREHWTWATQETRTSLAVGDVVPLTQGTKGKWNNRMNNRN